MQKLIKTRKKSFVVKVMSHALIGLFLASTISTNLYAQSSALPVVLPVPGKMLELSRPFDPVTVKGIIINPEHPFKFDFVMDSGETGLQGEGLRPESMKIIKYFLAALTVPDDEMWVNLSPYEKGRIIPKSFGETAMGRDLLAQDYILKQLTASLTYPERNMGKEFWDKVYAKAWAEYHTTNIPVDTFNKVWILPSKAKVYEYGNGAFVVESRLRVMMEEDYLSLSKHAAIQTTNKTHTIASQIVREIIIPALEKEVNEGANFANLRQVYQAMILATWYKIRLKDSILGQLYVNQDKTKGVALNDTQATEKIYRQYIEAFKKGVYNYVKEDYDPQTQQVIPRKYISGGFDEKVLRGILDSAQVSLPRLEEELPDHSYTRVTWEASPGDNAMLKPLGRRALLRDGLAAAALAAVTPRIVTPARAQGQNNLQATDLKTESTVAQFAKNFTLNFTPDKAHPPYTWNEEDQLAIVAILIGDKPIRTARVKVYLDGNPNPLVLVRNKTFEAGGLETKFIVPGMTQLAGRVINKIIVEWDEPNMNVTLAVSRLKPQYEKPAPTQQGTQTPQQPQRDRYTLSTPTQLYGWNNGTGQQKAYQDTGINVEPGDQVIVGYDLTDYSDVSLGVHFSLSTVAARPEDAIEVSMDKFHFRTGVDQWSKPYTVQHAIVGLRVGLVYGWSAFFGGSNSNRAKIQINKVIIVRAAKTSLNIIPAAPVREQNRQLASNTTLPVNGGIDLNAANLDLQIKRDEKGMPLPFKFQNLNKIRIDTLYPTNLHIGPSISVPVLLGSLSSSALPMPPISSPKFSALGRDINNSENT